MAILKDLIVLGNSRITSDLYAKTIYEDNVSLSSKYALSGHTHSYLPLGGGTLTGALNITSASWGNQLTLHRTGTDGTWGPSIRFYNNNTFLGTIGIDTSGNFYKGDDGSVKYKIWHEGNDGSGSGLDADTLDGNHANAFATSEHTHNKIICLGQYAYTNIAKDIPVNALSYKIISSGGNVLGDSQYELLHLPWSEGDWGNYLIFGANTGRVGVKYKSTGDVRELLTSSNYTDYTVKKDGTGASGTWGINVSGTAGGVSWDNVSNKPAIVYKKNNINFYPFIGSSNYSKWYKVTFPWSGYAPSTNRWLMTTMELVLGGSYSNGANGKIFLSYYFNINSSNVWTASDVRGIGIGNKLTHNSVQIKYDIANPGIFYIHVNESGNIYNSFAIENLTANDSAPSFDFLNTTITTISIDDIPSTADKTVPITFIESTNGSDLLSNGNTIWTSANDGSGSGLDADTLDGNHANAFALSGHTHSYLPLSGGTVTGLVTIKRDTTSGDIPILNLQNTTFANNSGFAWSTNTTLSNMGAGSNVIHLIGKANGINNQSYFGYHHAGDGSASNFATIGMYGKDYLLNIFPNGNVGIGTSTNSPTAKLDVRGSFAVIDDTSNTTYDALAYFRSYSNNDWGVTIDKSSSYSYGLYIKSGGEYGILNEGGTKLVKATCIGANSSPAEMLDVRGNITATGSVCAQNNNMYLGSTSGSRCHQQYDTSNECLKFLFD